MTTELEALRKVAEAARKWRAERIRVFAGGGSNADQAFAELEMARALGALSAAPAKPDEWQQLVGLLRRHINSEHFDQFDRWKMKDAMGNTVYIHLSYKPTAPEEVHGDLDASPPAAVSEEDKR